ncbi:phosphate signaling complex protein PhoU [Salinicoccus halodurans]|uniref:Phosphate-specific transport system accessory protein PhoU n=1 Tax=Salinicoccus halodurans TaxID=407035 RepID=A0A0F7HKL6_9STAP|nr:phosphate signaling complex protein PhoU [Salinicoccus halodurans]AKG74003.1 PhoU family transcriptional regulator [Salinicoccus halodurans]SFK59066.1 phosphate transport system protein [Salinicoccus halodurans]
MTYRSKFQREMHSLYQDVVKLGIECYRRLEGSTEVLSDADTGRARDLVRGDKTINIMEYDINTQVINLITTQQPVATDLRLIISSIKVADDLERISDNISNLGEVRKRVRLTNEKLLLRLSTMERLALLMLEDVQTAYENQDTDLCIEIIERDKDIDSLFVQITTTDIIEESDVFVTGQSQLTAKYLERIGDHIKNIAEHVYFVLTGEKYEKITER